MADYADLMDLERKPKQHAPIVATPPSANKAVEENIARKPANPQASKQVNQQTSLHANLQTDKHANPQSTEANKPVLEKFSTYMRADYKKRIKQIALDRDCDAYEVLQEAAELLFQSLDKQK